MPATPPAASKASAPEPPEARFAKQYLVIVHTSATPGEGQDVIEQLFGISNEQACLFGIRRTAQYWENSGSWASPMDVK